ncbi:MAG: Asp-tRNA(Asn)/Glu-tRNA(Gln) amidotransferase subunit GatC [Candidatus Eremiobacteraeota bacterium]|nr:Asp-tRNA(Asn)/Glu-tRNA(Gln) amidotransferase subunit GatC [Candidatus Eremiobacteraeota bacterium]
MASNEIDVAYVAKLARIALTGEELERLGRELGDLLEHVRAISELDTGDIPATAQVVVQRNVEREDTVGPSLDRSQILVMAPDAQGPYFRVPRIIAEES